MTPLRDLYAQRAQLGYELHHDRLAQQDELVRRYQDVQRRLLVAEKRRQVAPFPPEPPEYQYSWCSVCARTLSLEEEQHTGLCKKCDNISQQSLCEKDVL